MIISGSVPYELSSISSSILSFYVDKFLWLNLKFFSFSYDLSKFSTLIFFFYVFCVKTAAIWDVPILIPSTASSKSCGSIDSSDSDYLSFSSLSLENPRSSITMSCSSLILFSLDPSPTYESKTLSKPSILLTIYFLSILVVFSSF